MRSYFEDLEEELLKPYAVKSKYSKGRHFNEKKSETRTCFQRDRDRIIHSKSFRRLKHKTQVFTATSSDHYRTRLTHTIEVAQISRHLARLLRVNEDLSECIALAHDLGHTPFGHSGEEELNTLLQDNYGFEHNLHSLKIVEYLEEKYPNFPGLNLSFEVKEGLKKHETPYDTPSQNTTFDSIEAQITNIADEIAYNNHDLDDGLNSKLLNFDDLNQHITLWKDANKKVNNDYSNLSNHEKTHLINSQLISELVLNVFDSTKKNIKNHNITSLEDIQRSSIKLVSFSKEMNELNSELRNYLYSNLYKNPEIKDMNQTGKSIINSLYYYFLNNENDLPKKYQKKLTDKEIPSLNNTYFKSFSDQAYKKEIIANYIAGMTDRFAIKQYYLYC